MPRVSGVEQLRVQQLRNRYEPVATRAQPVDQGGRGGDLLTPVAERRTRTELALVAVVQDDDRSVADAAQAALHDTVDAGLLPIMRECDVPEHDGLAETVCATCTVHSARTPYGGLKYPGRLPVAAKIAASVSATDRRNAAGVSTMVYS